MDTRGQGSAWSVGDTPDPDGAARPGASRLHDPRHPRPARLLLPARLSPTPCARSRRRAAHEPSTPARVAVTGGSQGGGITHRGRGRSCPTCVAGDRRTSRSCATSRARSTHHRRRPVRRDRPLPARCTATRSSRSSHARLLRRRDPRRAGRRAPALFSVGLMDVRSARRRRCTPPTTPTAGPKEIREYPFNDHEGGGELPRGRQRPNGCAR